MDFFKNIYVINLDRRKDRWAEVQGELQKLGIQQRAQRISGVDLGSHPGCTASHKKFLDLAIQNGSGASLVIEDDAQIMSDWQESLHNGLKRLPDDWDILYLGYNLDPHSPSTIPPNFIGYNLIQLFGCLTTHMYAVNCNRLDRIKAFREYMDKYSSIIQIDMLFLTIILTHQFKTYGIYPMVAVQRAGFSDISNHAVTYSLKEHVDMVLRDHNKFSTRPPQ